MTFSLSAFSFSWFFSLDFLSTFIAILFVLSWWIKLGTTTGTGFVIGSVHQLWVQLFIQRQNTPLEVVAKDMKLWNELNASVSFSVIKQQAISVWEITATAFHKPTHFSEFLCVNFSPFLSRLMFQKWGFEYNYTLWCISCNTRLIKREYWQLKSVT